MNIFNVLFSTRKIRNRPILKAIYITSSAGGPMYSVKSVQALGGVGLEGDRYSTGRGFWKMTDACQVTVISEDDLNNARRGRSALLQNEINNGKHRRNLVVEGINQKQLLGKTFRIGEAVFCFYKPRPPCAYLEKIVGNGISRALGKHSGVCLTVRQGGIISVGDEIEIISL